MSKDQNTLYVIGKISPSPQRNLFGYLASEFKSENDQETPKFITRKKREKSPNFALQTPESLVMPVITNPSSSDHSVSRNKSVFNKNAGINSISNLLLTGVRPKFSNELSNDQRLLSKQNKAGSIYAQNMAVGGNSNHGLSGIDQHYLIKEQPYREIPGDEKIEFDVFNLSDTEFDAEEDDNHGFNINPNLTLPGKQGISPKISKPSMIKI